MRSLTINLKALVAATFFFLAVGVTGCEPEQNAAPAPLIGLESIAEAKGPNRPVSAAHNKVLAEIRQATVHYKKVENAIADGYVLSSPCVSTPAGGMGYHYVNNSLLMDGVDHTRPEALVYEPQKNGKLKLVAVEFIVVAESWDAMNSQPPMLGDQVFDDHRLGGGGPPFPHYQLHAWIWKHNPSGMHTPFNPTVSCEYAF